MKKSLCSLVLTFSLLLSFSPWATASAQTAFTIAPEEDSSRLTEIQLDEIANFLYDYEIISKCLNNNTEQENKILNAYTASCFLIQVFDTSTLDRNDAWQKSKDLGLFSAATGRSTKLTTLQYLDTLFKAAGITISPLSEKKYRNSLKKIHFRLNNENLKIIATALENGLIPEPLSPSEGRSLKNTLFNQPITIIDALAFLFQVTTSQHSETTIINISPYTDSYNDIELENTLKEIVNIIKTQSYFREDFDEKKAMQSAIKALVKSLEEDQYIEYYTEEEYEEFSTGLNGNLEGIGAYIEEENDQIIIVSPIEGSPAAKAGIQPGDIILKIDDTSTADLNLQQAVQMIRGPRGSQVKLTIIRAGKTMVFTIIREQISVPALNTYSKNNFEIIKLIQFGASSAFEMEQALKKAIDKRPEGIIIDLRNNPGGFLNEVITIVDLFLDKGQPIVYLDDQSNRSAMHSTNDPIIMNVPIAVLINKGSASAAEILAGSLQAYHIAKIYGEPSFGKGTVQNIIPLQENLQSGVSAFKLTTAEYLIASPDFSAISIEDSGIIPDSNPSNYGKYLVDDPDTEIDEAMEAVINSLSRKFSY